MLTENFQICKLYLEKEEKSDQVSNIQWFIEWRREFQKKNIDFWFIDYAKVFFCMDNNKLWKILKEMGISDPLTCLLRNLYAGQEATVRIGHETTHWFKIGKGIFQGCILSSCLFNFSAEYIMWNAGLDEAQTGIKTDRRNINNISFADDTTLMAESEELKSLLMKVKEESETRIERDTYTPMFIAALFIIARIWKQPRCPSADEWIRKLWYIYTMEYYSAIKKNTVESVLMRWMKL